MQSQQSLKKFDYIYIAIGSKGHYEKIQKTEIRSNWREQCLPSFVVAHEDSRCLVLLLDRWGTENYQKQLLSSEYIENRDNFVIRHVNFDVREDLDALRGIMKKLEIIGFNAQHFVLAYFIKFRNREQVSSEKYLREIYNLMPESYQSRIFEWWGYNLNHPFLMDLLIHYRPSDQINQNLVKVYTSLVSDQKFLQIIGDRNFKSLRQKEKAKLESIAGIIFPFTYDYFCCPEKFPPSLKDFLMHM